jgi:endonuclease/exonuclease/phosphatase family metal-dependent hydrolase
LERPEDGRLVAPERLRVLSWNVQYFAGKDYVFFYDLPDFSGPDLRPDPNAVDATLRNIAHAIEVEDPDIVLLQEVDEGAARTFKDDQAERLLGHLGEEAFPYRAEALYWRAGFVPHPKIAGSVGTKLVILSKYPIVEARRHALPQLPGSWLERQFQFKRAVLEVEIPLAGGQRLHVLNTHFDAFTAGTDTIDRQARTTLEVIEGIEKEGNPWILGGDLNALAPGEFPRLPDARQPYYKEKSPLEPFYERFSAIPTLAELQGPERRQWLTYYPNDPAFARPSWTLDYIFLSDAVRRTRASVVQGHTWTLSDHLPILVDIRVE